MKTDEIIIANLKCSGCASSIINNLTKIPGVKDVAVEIEKDSVSVLSDNTPRELIIQALHNLGYPEATEENGLLLQIKSYASCMVGRVQNAVNTIQK